MNRFINWLIFFVYVAIIYSTLGVVQRIWDSLALKYGGLPTYILYGLFGVFVVGCLSYMFFYLGKRGLKDYSFLAAAVIGYICLFVILKRYASERVHTLEYGLLGYISYRAVRGKNALKSYTFAVLITAIIGNVDELIQFFLPNRYYDPRDAIVNALCGLLGILIVHALKRPKNADFKNY